MKTRIVLICLSAATCLALGLALARTDKAPPDNAKNTVPDNKGAKAEAVSAEEEAIRKAFTAYNVAYAKGDLDAVLATWTQDAEFIDDDGTAYSGRKALSQLFAKSLPSFKGYKITGKITSVRFIKPDV